jgi:hypothetical protein
MEVEEAYFAADRLYDDLRATADKDPEQEIHGVALVTIDAVLDACREFVPDHPIISRLRDVISPEAIEAGDPIRVVDVVPAIGQIVTALRMERDRWLLEKRRQGDW